MKILILGNSSVGLYKFRRELLQELTKSNEVFFSVPNGDFVDNIKKIGCTFIETTIERRGTNPINDLQLIRQYKMIMSSIKPDVVLTYTIKPNVYGGIVCQLRGIPYIVNITGLGSAVENSGSIIYVVTMLLYRIGLRKANMVFFQNTDNMRFMIEKGIVKNRYDIIPGSGVNTEQFSVSEYPKRDITEFMYVGRMMREKGFELYIDAAERIYKKYPNTHFHICGSFEENYKDRVNKLIEKGFISYHGLVEDMKSMYDRINCTIHPTYYPEGMSNVLLESLSCGRPIITTDRAGCKEIVDDGVNGFVVKQNDLDSLINAIERFLHLTRKEQKELGLRGRNKIEQLFNRKIVVKKYIDTINTVVK